MDYPTKNIIADGLEIAVRPVTWRQWRQLVRATDHESQLDAMEQIADACATLPDTAGGPPSEVLTRAGLVAVFSAATLDETEQAGQADQAGQGEQGGPGPDPT